MSEKSVYDCWRFADRFLEFRFNGKRRDLSKITPVDIARFMQHLISRGKPFRDKTPPTHLRNFFRFLFKSGRTNANLAPSVPRIARDSVQFRAPNTEQWKQWSRPSRWIQRLGGAPCHGASHGAARLRAAEVIAIQIDDRLAWASSHSRQGAIADACRFRGMSVKRWPITSGRTVATSRSLFVGTVPHRPFAGSQVISEVLKNAFERTKLNPPTRYVGSHILRHSLATNMVRHGASFAEIGEVLRHRARRSTMIYAKLDVDGLRSVAQPWPVVGGAK